MFASCDDRGKNPGGSGSNEMSVQVALPAGLYDGATWQMSLTAAEEDAEPIEAKSVSFVPAKDAEGGKALVIGTGFPMTTEALMGSAITVTYTLPNGTVNQSSAVAISGFDLEGKTLTGSVSSWTPKTPQTITLTATGPAPASEGDVSKYQLTDKGWTISLAAAGKAPISVTDFTPTVKTPASYSEEGTAAVVSIAFNAGKNNIPDGTYTATVQYGTGENMLQGSASSIAVTAGTANPEATAVTLNPTNGQITVKIPENIAIGDDEIAATKASISYILAPGSASPVSVPASAIKENAFTISGLEAPAEAVKYSITVIATYNGADYVVEASEQFDGPTSEAATAEEDLSEESFGGISLQVTLAVGSNSGLNLASLPKAGWTVAYTECDSKGNPLAGATAATFTMPSDSPSASGQFTIAGLKYGAQYLVSAALETENTIYSGSAFNEDPTDTEGNTISSLQLLITGGAVPFGSSGITIAAASIQFGVDSGLSALAAATNDLEIGGSFTPIADGAITVSAQNIAIKGSIAASDLGKALPLNGTITQSGSVYTLENSSVTFFQSKTGVISATATITTGDGVSTD